MRGHGHGHLAAAPRTLYTLHTRLVSHVDRLAVPTEPVLKAMRAHALSAAAHASHNDPICVTTQAYCAPHVRCARIIIPSESAQSDGTRAVRDKPVRGIGCVKLPLQRAQLTLRLSCPALCLSFSSRHGPDLCENAHCISQLHLRLRTGDRSAVLALLASPGVFGKSESSIA